MLFDRRNARARFTSGCLGTTALALVLGLSPALADGGKGGNADYGQQANTEGGAGGIYGGNGGDGSPRAGGGRNTGAGGGGGGAVDANGNGGTGGAGASSGGGTAGPLGGTAGSGTVTSGNSITGGAGGAGSAGVADGISATGASGGGGGAAAYIGNNLILNGHTYIGGAGGAGGDGQHSSGGDTTGAGGGGGSGGYGAILTGGSINANDGTIQGGSGGNGGAGAHSGSGGDGGIGALLASGTVLYNYGSITGGNGGVAGTSQFDSLTGQCCTWASSDVGNVGGSMGAGGVGVVGSGIDIENIGTISGGLSGDGVTRADAIDFTGGANTLDMVPGTITGNIDIASGASMALTQAGGASFLGIITGGGDVAIDSDVHFTGANTYTGTTTVSGTYLYLSGAGSIAASSELYLSNRAALDISTVTSGATVLLLSGDNTTSVVLGSKALTLGATDGTFAGTISGNGGSLVVDGTLVSLSGANTFTGGVTVQSGTLEVFSNQALGSGGTVALNDLTLLTLSGSDIYNHALTLSGATGINLDSSVSGGATWSGLISDGGSAGSLTLDGGGTLALTNNGNSYSGGTNVIGSSTLVLDQDGEIGTGTLILADSNGYGILQLAGSFNLSNSLGIGDSTGFIDTNGFDMTIAQAVTGTGGMLEKVGAGTLTLTGTGSDLGGLEAAGGTLLINGGASVQVANLIVGNGTDAAQLTLDGAGTTLISSNATTFLNGSASAVNFTISGGAAYTSQMDVVLLGVSTDASYIAPVVTITGANSIWHADGGVEIGEDFGPLNFSGIVNVAAGGTLDSGTSVIDIAENGILNIGLGGTAGNVISPQINNAGKIVADFTDSTTVAANIDGAGSLTKQGSGTLILTSDINDYTGGTTISGGMLQLGDGIHTGYISGDVTDNATLAFAAATGSPLTFGGAISGSGGVTVLGGEVTLTGANSYHGGTVVSGGTLYVGSIAALGNDTGSLAVTGGTLDLYGNSITVGTLTGTGGTITTTNGDATLSANVASGTTTLATNLQDGAGALELDLDASATGGTVILTGNNNLSGGIVMVGGTLQAGATGVAGAAVSLFDANFRTTADTTIVGLGLAGIGTDHVSAAAGTTLTITGGTLYGDTVNPETIIFGSNTDTGTIVFGGFSSGSLGSTIEVAGGTVRDSGDGNLVAAFDNIASFTVDAGTTFDVNDAVYPFAFLSPGGNLLGAGSVTLGSSAATILPLSGGNFSGVISGAGGIELQFGTLALSGINTYSGGTTIDTGATLNLSGAITGNVADNGALIVNRASALTLGGVVSGNGALTLAGNATTTLSGISTFTGATHVDAGTLNVTGSLAGSAVTVASGATLSGSGKVGGTSVASGGAINAAGLTVQGNLILASGSASTVTLPPASTTAPLTITGTGALNGTLSANIQQTGSYQTNHAYALVTANGGLSGSFSSMALSGVGAVAYRPTFSSDANDIFVTLRYNALTPLLTNATPNEAVLAGALDKALTSGANLTGVPLSLFGLAEPALNNALDQLSGQIGANTAYGAGADFAPFLQLLMTQGGGDTQMAANFAPGQMYGANDAPQKAQLGATSLTVWGKVFGGHTGLSADAQTGAAGLSASNYGFAGGVEAQWVGGLTAGASLGGGKQDFASGNGTGHSNDVLLGLYARQSVAGQGYVAGAFGYGWHDIVTTRTVTVSGTDVLRAAFNANQYGGRIEGGYRFALDEQTGLAPYAAIAAENFDAPAYAEQAVSGTGAVALAYAAQTTPVSHAELGARLGHSYDLDDGSLSLEGTAAWAHQMAGLPSAQASLQGLASYSFVTYGVRPARDTALLGLHANVQRRDGLSFGVGVDDQVGAGTTVIEGSGTFRYRW